MMGRLKHEQEQLFYEFELDKVVPDDHLVREIAAVLDLSWVRAELASYYSPLGRPSIDPLTSSSSISLNPSQKVAERERFEPPVRFWLALAVDLVSVKGETRAERGKSSEILWKWIDAHEQELGIGRPYLDRDPPHVAPIDGKEYAAKRGRAKTQLAGSAKTRRAGSAANDTPGMTKRAKTASR